MTSLVKQWVWEAQRTLRNRQFLFGSIAMPLIFYFIFLKVNGSNLQLEGTTWKTYFLMSMASFSVIGACLFGLAGRVSYERTQGWLRLVQTTPLSNSAYLTTKFISQFVISAVSILALFLVGAFAEGVQLSFGQWVESGLWLILGALPFISMGMLIGILITVEATYLVANILNLVLGILGGLWFPIAIMPTVMQDIAKWTPSYRFAHVAWQVIAGLPVNLSDIGVLAGYLAVFVLLTLWVLRRQEERDS